MSTKIRTKVKLQKKKKIIKPSKVSGENYYSQLTGIDKSGNKISDSSLRNFTRSDEKIMNPDGNGFIFETKGNKNSFLLNSKVGIIRFKRENNIRDLIKEQSDNDNYDEIWQEISIKLGKLKYKTKVSSELINTILNTQNITQEFINLIGKMSSSEKESGTLNIDGIKDYRNIMYNLSNLIFEKLNMNVAFYNHLVSDILGDETKPTIMFNNLSNKLIMIYTKFSTEKICIHSSDKKCNNICNIVQFINIEKFDDGSQRFIDLFEFEDGKLVPEFVENYVDSSLELSKTKPNKKHIKIVQKKTSLSEYIQFNPMDSLQKLPSISIKGKEYLLGYSKDNGRRNLYTAIDNGIKVNGEIEISDKESGDNKAEVWWCE